MSWKFGELKPMSETPRTDALVAQSCGRDIQITPDYYTMLGLARMLERELALANARIDYLMSPDSSSPEMKLTREQILNFRERWSGHEQELSLAEHEALCDMALASLERPEDRAIALLRELNDALAVPGYLQARVDEILDRCEPQLPKA